MTLPAIKALFLTLNYSTGINILFSLHKRQQCYEFVHLVIVLKEAGLLFNQNFEVDTFLDVFLKF